MAAAPSVVEITPRIAVFDSGIGGTGVLAEIRARAPWADLVYVADRAFGAYGERSLDDVRERTELAFLIFQRGRMSSQNAKCALWAQTVVLVQCLTIWLFLAQT